MGTFPTRFDFTADEIEGLQIAMLGDDVPALIARGRFVAHSWHRRSQDPTEPERVRQFAGDIASLQSELAEALAAEHGRANAHDAERFTTRPGEGTRVEIVGTGGRGVVVEPEPADVQRVRVCWDDGITSTIRCEQLRPEAAS